jgi:hypothetical protein
MDTPGDAYDLYIDKNYMAEWIYRSKGVEKPSLNTRWENTVKKQRH